MSGPVCELSCDFFFEAAHRLPKVEPGHKCASLHGHSYRVTVCVKGPVDPRSGMVVDFACVKRAFSGVEEALDHRYLNEVEGLENPTAENLAVWIWERLSAHLPLSKVVVHETPHSAAGYEGPSR
jgi:6-pyruvoyltetrahydropterin/6-carboxytetrahydropterin synthase